MQNLIEMLRDSAEDAKDQYDLAKARGDYAIANAHWNWILHFDRMVEKTIEEDC